MAGNPYPARRGVPRGHRRLRALTQGAECGVTLARLGCKGVSAGGPVRRQEGKPMDAAGKSSRISDATLLEEVLATRKELSTLTEELTHANQRAAQAVGPKEGPAPAPPAGGGQNTAPKEGGGGRRPLSPTPPAPPPVAGVHSNWRGNRWNPT